MSVHLIDLRPSEIFTAVSGRGADRVIHNVTPSGIVVYSNVTGFTPDDVTLGASRRCKLALFLSWAKRSVSIHDARERAGAPTSTYDIYVVPGKAGEGPHTRGSYLGQMTGCTAVHAESKARAHWPETYAAFNFDNHIIAIDAGSEDL